jgi:putative phage-type endonuclease
MNDMPAVIDRSRFIGGSDIAAILGISPWRNVVELWLDKTRPLPNDETRVTLRGKRMESYIVDMVEAEFNIAIAKVAGRNKRYVDQRVPYFSCEVDAETLSTPVQNIEIKTVHPFKAQEWGDLETDQLPLHYLAQVQWGLSITNREVCGVFALIGDDLRHYVVERDEPTIEAMRARAIEFWERFVIPREQPPLDYSDPKTLEVLKRLYPGTDGRKLEATQDDVRWRETMAEAQAKADAYTEVAKGCKAHLLDAMGSAALLKFADGKALRRKLTKRKGYTVAETEYMDARFVSIKE